MWGPVISVQVVVVEIDGLQLVKLGAPAELVDVRTTKYYDTW